MSDPERRALALLDRLAAQLQHALDSMPDPVADAEAVAAMKARGIDVGDD